MRLVTFKELGPLYGIWYCRTSLRRMMDPKSPWYAAFPRPISPTRGRIAWRSTDIETWVKSRPEQLSLLPLLEEENEPPLGRLPKAPTGELTDYRDK